MISYMPRIGAGATRNRLNKKCFQHFDIMDADGKKIGESTSQKNAVKRMPDGGKIVPIVR